VRITGRANQVGIIGMGVIIALSTAACGGSGGAGSGGGDQTATALSGADLVAAAKKEGSLTWYTSYSDDESRSLAAAFNKKYPGITVNRLQGSVDKLTARLGTEQRAHKHNADVFQGDASYATQLIDAGVLAPYNPPDAQAPPASIGLPKGFANVDAVLTTVIAYNPTVLRQKGLTPPKSFADLTKPAWKGQFSADARGVNWYEALITSMGKAKARALVDALGSNAPRLSESHTLALTQVQAGEPMATIAAYGYLAAKDAKASPSSVAFVNPDPLPAAPDVIELVNGAPHADAARLFIDWLLSHGGQRAVVSISNRISLRNDVSDDPAAWNPAKWPPARSTPDAPSSQFNTYSQNLRSAMKAE
jgi:iron(III) transport system substrate-binding protein